MTSTVTHDHRSAAHAVFINDSEAYIRVHPWAQPGEMREAHQALAARGFELMDPTECPAEPFGDGLRLWAALADGGQ